MTQDDIIRVAVQCQLVTAGNREGVYMDALTKFADTVAAAERESCAKVSDRFIGSDLISSAIRAGGNT